MGVGGSFDLLRRRRAPAVKDGTVAKSRFATREDIDAYGIGEDRSKPDDGLYLGFFCDDGKRTQLRYRGTKHGLFFGTPGANKSMGIVASVLAHTRRSAIVVDPKASLCAVTMRKRATFGKTIILNPFGVLVDELPHLQSTGWNPLLQLDPKSLDFEEGAGCIADAIIEKSADAKNPFFDNQAEAFTSAWVMFERWSKGAKANLTNLRAELCKPTFYDKVTKEPVSGFLYTLKMMAACAEIPAVADVGGRLYGRLSDDKSQSTSVQDCVDTVLSQAKFLSNPHIKADFANGGAIDFAALHREVTTIYLILQALIRAWESWLLCWRTRGVLQ
jgi:Type IV secretory system Conjugative DNA transfer